MEREQALQKTIAMYLEGGFAVFQGFVADQEGLPISTENRLNEAFDLRNGPPGRGGKIFFITPNAGYAVREAVNDGSWDDGIRPEEFQERQRLNAHLVDTSVDVPAVQ